MPEVNGILLVPVIMGLVEFLKKVNVSGIALTVSSLVIGTGLGIAYQCSIAIPVSYAGWFGASVYGLALGLSACGLYDFVVSLKKQ